MSVLQSDPNLHDYAPSIENARGIFTKRSLERARKLMRGKGGRLPLKEFIKLGWHVIEPARSYVQGWHIDALSEHLEALTDRQITRLAIAVPPGTMKSLTTAVYYPAWLWGPEAEPSKRIIGFSYDTTLSTRDALRTRRLIQSDWYQRLWGSQFQLLEDENVKTRYANDQTGFRISDYVGGGTGDRGDVLIVDDPHRVKDPESDAMRKSALLWLHETMPTRLNDPEFSSIVVIHHRLHEQDMIGEILASDLGYEYLMLPMEFEKARRCVTKIGFKDPRKEEGELLFPERFPREVVERDKKAMGSFAVCTPAESPVLMADLTLKPISQVKAGDSVVGWSMGEVQSGASFARQKLQPSKVVNVFHYVGRDVVKLTLDTGEIARCTPEHRWYRRRRDDYQTGEPISDYRPASVGSPLVRVCPTHLPELNADEQWLAGWLCGFYEGEGTVSFTRRRGNDRPVGRIAFHQGAGRNLPLCERLEHALDYFGFDYSVSLDERKDPTAGVNFEYRIYTLRGASLPLMQRFLHIVKPVKWRERMIEVSYGTTFCIGKERVEKIEPDGNEDVYALETETGNYVVWGLASSNSGQFQQRPAPRGGGMIKRDWFEIVNAAAGDCYWVRRWDLAASIDPNASFTAGVLMGYSNSTKMFYIKDVKRAQIEGDAVKRLIMQTAALDVLAVGKKNYRIVLPQDPGQAGTQSKDFMNMLIGYDARTELETGDKITRATPFAAQCEAENVKLVRGEWIEAFLDEATEFPQGRFNDQMDAASGAFSTLIMRPKQAVTFAAVRESY